MSDLGVHPAVQRALIDSNRQIPFQDHPLFDRIFARLQQLKVQMPLQPNPEGDRRIPFLIRGCQALDQLQRNRDRNPSKTLRAYGS